MDLLDPLSQTFDRTAVLLDGLRPEHLDRPTPCPEWTVRELLGHTFGVVEGMGRGARGEALTPRADVVLDDDPAAQFRGIAAATLAGWTACDLDGEVNVGAGPMPAAMALGINLVDTTGHSWDIARATGQDAEIPAEIATTALTVGRGFITDQLRERVGFAPAITPGPDASPSDQLVAFLGRKP